MKELTLDAIVDNIEEVTSFVNNELEKLSCPASAKNQIDIAIDEIFGNIVRYAYTPKIGKASVKIDVLNNPLAIVITFTDNGKPFNPLNRADPDVSLSLDERKEGGLGIFLVKKTMNLVDYEYKDGKNILKIKKNLE